jgi:acetylornithine deacetylase/succinyl-diaminopimelate desuccinylase family protein
VIDRDAILDALQKLVSINSVNPGLAPAGPGETEIARYVAGWLEALGLDVQRLEPQPGRPSIVGRLAGTGGGRSLMLNAHFDTVGVEGMDAPFSGELRDGKVYGRGAYDMKGSLAACLGAVRALVESGHRPAGDVLVAAVADEEVGSLGTTELLQRWRTDGAIVTEPTGLELCVAHKGFVWIEVVTEGRAAHGSRFELGIDANMRMGRVLHELDGLEAEVRRRRAHPLLGSASLHAPVLRGGSGPSTYADRCMLQIEWRTLPGETTAEVEAEVQAILDRLGQEDPSFRARSTTLLARDAFETRPDAPLATAVAAAAEEVRGKAPKLVGDSAWMDAALTSRVGIETVVIGPIGAGAHAEEEWVDLESVYVLADILVRATMTYCGG